MFFLIQPLGRRNNAIAIGDFSPDQGKEMMMPNSQTGCPDWQQLRGVPGSHDGEKQWALLVRIMYKNNSVL